jgi:hypothetical protein
VQHTVPKWDTARPELSHKIVAAPELVLLARVNSGHMNAVSKTINPQIRSAERALRGTAMTEWPGIVDCTITSGITYTASIVTDPQRLHGRPHTTLNQLQRLEYATITAACRRQCNAQVINAGSTAAASHILIPYL